MKLSSLTGLQRIAVITFVAVLALVVAIPDPASAVDRTRGKKKRHTSAESRELWYVVKIMGSPVGFAKESEESTPDGMRISQIMNLTMSRMGQKMSMFMSGESLDGLDGRLRSGKLTVQASTMTVVSTAVLEGDTVRYKTESAGFERTRSIPWEEGAMGPATADAYVIEQLRAHEREFSYRSFEIESGEFRSFRIVRIDADPVEIDGRTQSPIVIEDYEGDADIARSTIWLDENYTLYKTLVLQMGLEIVVERVTPDEMEHLELEPEFDIIRRSMIPCEGYPDDPSALEDVTMRLDFERMPSDVWDFNGPNQVVEQRGETFVDLLVSRETVNRMSMSGAEKQDGVFLHADRYIQSTDARIQAVADSVRRAVGGSDWEVANALAAWVNGHITEKNFGQGFASALEVLETRTGDCTEHSVLLTSLLRAAGIPARPAVGLAYSNGQLVGHMWTEAHVEYWRTLDALDLDTLPIRIRVSAAQSDRAFDQKDLVGAYNVVGGLRVKVLKYNPIE
jgi:hypothetical protein